MPESGKAGPNRNHIGTRQDVKVEANSFKRMWAQCGSDIHAAVEAVGASGWYILGQEVAAFEAALAEAASLPFAIGVGNGMDALEISLHAAGMGPGDAVLCPPLSAFPTALAVLRAGGVPVFADVDENGALDPAAAAECLSRNPSIRFMIPVHLYGHMADMKTLGTLAMARGVTIIEDAAQAIGATRAYPDGTRLQVGEVGSTACYSFYPTKNLGAIGDGGALVTADTGIDRQARAMRNYGQSAQYIHDIPGMNSRLDELHAAVMHRALLPRLAGWTDRRRHIAKRYLAAITHPDIILIPGPDPDGSVWHLFPVLAPAAARDGLMTYLRDAGIQVGVHYPKLMNTQNALSELAGTARTFGSLERAQAFTECEISLPIHPFLEEDEIGHVIDTLNGWRG